MGAQLNDIVRYGDARFKVVHAITQLDLHEIEERLRNITTKIDAATNKIAGHTKLYNNIGSNNDGTITQSVVNITTTNLIKEINMAKTRVLDLMLKVTTSKNKVDYLNRKMKSIADDIELPEMDKDLEDEADNALAEINKSYDRVEEILDYIDELQFLADSVDIQTLKYNISVVRELTQTLSDSYLKVSDNITELDNLYNEVEQTVIDREHDVEYLEDLVDQIKNRPKNVGIEVHDVSNVNITANASTIALTWKDPNDLICKGITLARWLGTLLVRKEGSMPNDVDDGVVITNNVIKNQYQTNAYIDDTVENGKIYYYRFFPYTNNACVFGTTVRSKLTTKTKNNLTLSSDNISLVRGTTINITANTSSDGVITATSSNDNIQVSVDDKTLTIYGDDVCNGTITVLQDEGTTYAASNIIYITVQVTGLSKTLNLNTPEVIQETIANGLHTSVWDIGDTIDIEINGTVGDVVLSDTYSFMILGMDHNNDKELIDGYTHSMHLGLFKIGFTDWTGDKGAAIYDEGYGRFYHQNPVQNTGGWNNSNLRNICEEFYNILPQNWKNIIKAIPKYTDNVGGDNQTSASISSTVDNVWLLSEYEIWGRNFDASQYEKNYQKQYEYYINGNSHLRHGHQQDVMVTWWTRSPGKNNRYEVVTNGEVDHHDLANVHRAFVPCFAILG